MQTFHASALGFRVNQKTGFLGELGLGYQGVVSAGLKAHFWVVSLPPLILYSAGMSPRTITKLSPASICFTMAMSFRSKGKTT